VRHPDQYNCCAIYGDDSIGIRQLLADRARFFLDLDFRKRASDTLGVGAEPLTNLRVPLILNLRLDTYERGHRVEQLLRLLANSRVYARSGADLYREVAASFLIDQVMENLNQPMHHD
jgi:hypothetical protein